MFAIVPLMCKVPLTTTSPPNTEVPFSEVPRVPTDPETKNARSEYPDSSTEFLAEALPDSMKT